MSKSGKWSCVSQSDSNQFGNCPLQWDNEFHWEHDQNPSAWRRRDHYEWVGKGFISPQKIESFHRDTTKLSQETDTDTVDDFYVGKEILMGAVVESKSTFNGWSIVVRTVIRWEEMSLKRQKIKVKYREPKPNSKPADLKHWEETHEQSHTRLIRTNRRNVRRRLRQTVNLGNASKHNC